MDLGIEPRIFSWYLFEPETDALPLRQPTISSEAQQETGRCGSGSTLPAGALTTSILNTSWQAHIGL